MRPFDDITRIERAQVLDKPVAVVRAVVTRILRHRTVKDALHGVWLGHPLHPGAAQFTAGSLLSASMLDAVGAPVGGGRLPSSFLIAAGLATAPVTAAAGWADWSESHEDQMRVGLVHAATNVVALSLYGAALVRRARGGRGRLLSLAGGAVAGAGALIGGHLGYRQATGANHGEEIAHIGPEDWQSLGPLAEVPVGKPVQRVAGGVPVFVLRQPGSIGPDGVGPDGISVLSDRCPHLSAPLHDGEIVDVGGEAHVICPWHSSEFRVADGCVVHGPATAPVPRFESRVVGDELQARVVTIPGVPAS
jgi:nitrite reductase/ring-hydroxylating ferredoxin subunit